MRTQADSNRCQVSHDLVGIGVEAYEQGALVAQTCGLGESPAQCRLRGTGETRDEYAGATVVTASKHRVEAFYTTGYAFLARVRNASSE